ncbi:hypothetical protein Nepgr_030568 [Nepenthes gracilis]|uniref:DYW domain-containing protein n=1 Tax=Nepenthes gracilis TaxID=150966 RepID=A0AAD3Y5Y1_NEPGR|nr:hypothetical protein Nepgr_030568 [Nepenthes gracilis]
MVFQKQRSNLNSPMLKDPATLGLLIQIYTQTSKINRGKELHARLIRAASTPSRYVVNNLLNMYAKCGQLGSAQKLFEGMRQRNLVSWTVMITAYAQKSQFLEAVRTFSQMRVVGQSPTQFAFSSVIQASTSLGCVKFGRQMHCLSVKCGFNCELFVGSNLADMYSKCGEIFDACKVFQEMPYKDEVSWTSMIHGYAKNGEFKEAVLSFKQILHEGIVIDRYLLCSASNACGATGAYKLGKCLHSMILKLGFEEETVVGNALTDLYSKSGDMESASKVFCGDSKFMNIVSYTSLIDGYVEADQSDKALGTFLELRRQAVEPNEFTFSSLIKACSNQAALEQGTQLHGQVVKFNLASDPFVYSTLLDMYGKCGLVGEALQLFDMIENPTEIAWNSLLGVFAHHGSGKDAIKVFDRMIFKGLKPNSITFANLLKGCSHGGLVEEGLDYFLSMEKKFGVAPKEEHYSCIIDLLSRAGWLKEAEEFINGMPFEPNAFGWCSYLAACRNHGDRRRGEIAAEKLMKLEPENSGAHILLSNIYAKERQWEGVRNMRKTMRDGNLRKLPGFSWVDIGNKTHVFGAEDWSHDQKTEIYSKLYSLIDQIKKAGYIPYTDSIPYEMNESMKEKQLFHHSEKIAVAFALISMPFGKPIIVKKNLRMCLDCHCAIKFISKVVGRTIIVRDNCRFHHFSDGSCSCGDYW